MAFKSLFFPARNKRLSNAISIETPQKFKNSVKTLSNDGLSLSEFRALKLAQTRAGIHLLRKNLSNDERKQMQAIKKVSIKR